MLIIRTGKPGHGKTLNTIREVDQKAYNESRPVYFHNINGLKPELLKAQWYSFDDPYTWFDLPHNAIIVVDEAQGWFGARDPRNRPPEHITRFETMRHAGHEVHLITQDPRYIDVHLRRLCNCHIHYWRVFKSTRLIRFESETVIEKVEVKSSFKDADKRTLKLDPKIFAVYTSSNADHHFAPKVPLKFLLAACVILAAGFLVYRAVDRVQAESVTADVDSSPASPSPSETEKKDGLLGGILDVKTPSRSTITREEYAALHTPRIPDLPSSAPIYDELTKPKTYPKLSCFMSSDPSYIERNSRRYRVVTTSSRSYICECFTQQGSRHETSFSFCKSVVHNGFFDPAKPDPSDIPNHSGGSSVRPNQKPQPSVTPASTAAL